jgi:hypothetical protein
LEKEKLNNKNIDVYHAWADNKRHLRFILKKYFKPCLMKHQGNFCDCHYDYLTNKFKEIFLKLKELRNRAAHPFSDIKLNFNYNIFDLKEILNQMKDSFNLIAYATNQIISSGIIRVNQNDENICENLVDLILCGQIESIPFINTNVEYRFSRCKSREDFYKNLHINHDACILNNQTDKCFNVQNNGIFEMLFESFYDTQINLL